MAWIDEFPGAAALGDRAERALRWPVGVASPLWVVFGAAATTGVAYWWLTQWTRVLNIEALGSATAPAELPVHIAIEVAPADAPPAEPVGGAADAALAMTEAQPVLETAPAAVEPERAEAIAPPAPAPLEPATDDLTRLVGIGPKLAEALAASGVNRFTQIAAWTDEDLAKVDAALSLKGRAVRDAWVAQARRLAGE